MQTVQLSFNERNKIIEILKSRFLQNTNRHKNFEWTSIEAKLLKNEDKLFVLNQMELTGGEPDVVTFDNEADSIYFVDCSLESPIGRRSLCYDQDALNSRKANKPLNSAVGFAREMGFELLSENEYRNLQKYGNFDLKTSSWLQTPADIRKLGGAIFGDWRYGRVFVYHNGVESYYASRGFRGILKI